MRVLACLSLALLFHSAARADREDRPLVAGLKSPSAAIHGPDGRLYVAVQGDGAVLAVQGGKTSPFATGLKNPIGLAMFQQFLFVLEPDRVLRLNRQGKVEVMAGPEAFPEKTVLTGIEIDPESGTIYLTARPNSGTPEGLILRWQPRRKVEVVADSKRAPGLKLPGAVVMDGASHLLVLCGSGELLRIKIATGQAEKLAEGLGRAGGLAWDHFGRLFVGDRGSGKIFAIPRPGVKPVVLTSAFKELAGLRVDPADTSILAVDQKAGTVTALPLRIPGWEVDTRPLPLETAVAFPDLKWTGWKGPEETGKVIPLRPILLTHAGDGSNRVFVPDQRGVIHVFPNDQKARQTSIFLDIRDRVRYSDNQNEEGFLGLAFHPSFKKNGEFFVFYTPKKENLTNVVSRFRLSKDDPGKADPASEEVLLKFKKPFWNHDGGTLCFGPDGYLYITHGDGGSANDPFDNGQKLSSLLGKVLRIDVDRKDNGKPYAIPRDNPFVGHRSAAPEIWAYGLRNIWRMAFDRKTGKLWAGEVGQNLYEEINIIEKGGNYGWRRREALHPFGRDGVGPNRDMIEPIWEYHHDLGKSITGGHVYRGQALPELEGHYLYADYVTGRIWALKYDEDKGRVIANRPIKSRGLPIMSFGEDEKGEVYLMTYTSTGQGLFRFVRSKP